MFPVQKKTEYLAGEAALPYSIIGCCEINKHSADLFLWPKSYAQFFELKELLDLRSTFHAKTQFALWVAVEKTALFMAHCQQVPKTHSAEHRRPHCKQDERSSLPCSAV